MRQFVTRDSNSGNSITIRKHVNLYFNVITTDDDDH